MFTVADIYNIAIQIERNGEKEYKKAALSTDNDELKKLYTWMAKQEGAHASWFARLLLEKPEQSRSQQELNELGREMLQNIISESSFPLDGKELQQVTTTREAMALATTQEEDTIALYEFLCGLIEDEEVCADLRHVIEEEQEHIRTLERMRAVLEGKE